MPLYISHIRQIVGYRTPVFIQPFPWRHHITITYNLPHLWLWYPDVVTVIANTGSRLPNNSDVKTWKRRNVVGIDMIRNNRIDFVFHVETWQARKTKRNLQFLTNLSKPEWCVDNSWKTSQFRFSLPFIQFIISYGDQT